MVPLNPKPFLQQLTGKRIAITLKWGQEYRGMLAAVDQYMNVQLEHTVEFDKEGASQGELGQVLIRCNNILYFQEWDQDTMQQD